MTRGVLVALAGGLLGGALYLAMSVGSFSGLLLAYLSQVPLFLTGLHLGVGGMALANGIALVAVAVFGGLPSAGLFAATNAGPALVLVRQALLSRPAADGSPEWYPPGLLVAWLTAFPVVVLLGAGLVTQGSEGGLEGLLRGLMAPTLATMLPQTPDGTRIADAITALFPGMIACSWMLMTTVNGSLAQGVLAGFGRALRPSPRMAVLVLPPWILYALGLAVALAVATDGTVGYIARNLTAVLALPFFLQGLGVAHALIGRWRTKTLSLFLFYLLVLVLGWPALLVTGLGLADQVFGFRARWAARDAGPNGEGPDRNGPN